MCILEFQFDEPQKVLTVTINTIADVEALVNSGVFQFVFNNKNFTKKPKFFFNHLKVPWLVEVIHDRETEDVDITHLVRVSN